MHGSVVSQSNYGANPSAIVDRVIPSAGGSGVPTG